MNVEFYLNLQLTLKKKEETMDEWDPRVSVLRQTSESRTLTDERFNGLKIVVRSMQRNITKHSDKRKK